MIFALAPVIGVVVLFQYNKHIKQNESKNNTF